MRGEEGEAKVWETNAACETKVEAPHKKVMRDYLRIFPHQLLFYIYTYRVTGAGVQSFCFYNSGKKTFQIYAAIFFSSPFHERKTKTREVSEGKEEGSCQRREEGGNENSRPRKGFLHKLSSKSQSRPAQSQICLQVAIWSSVSKLLGAAPNFAKNLHSSSSFSLLPLLKGR